MTLDSLPAEITLNIVSHLHNSTSALYKLSQTCKALHRICQPLLYRKIHLKNPRNVLLPLAFTLFTNPDLARNVRSIRLPALSTAPRIAQQDSSRHDQKRQKPVRRGWPDRADLDSVLHDQVATALDGEADSIEACFSTVRDGSREDLIVMLILMNTPNLEELHIGAMGSRDDISHTRAMFRHAVPRLTKLSKVSFGRDPKDLSDSDSSRTDLEFSFSLFADLFRLPALEELRAYAIGPRQSEDISDTEWDTFFDFIYDIKTDNTSLKRLVVAEQLGASNAHLDHILKHCPALEWFEFMTREASGTDEMAYDWGSQWDVHDLHKTLQSCAGSLRTLILPDCLFHETATLDDQRTEINLRKLDHLETLYIDNSWLFSAGDLGYENDEFDPDHVKHRFVTLLPNSIKILRLNQGSERLDIAINYALRNLIEKHRAGQGFPNLKRISLEQASEEGVKVYEDTFVLARAAGVRVFQKWE